MELFVNRENELQLIHESFSALLDKQRLLRTPIIEFQGVSGIGKTSLLKQIEKRCHAEQLPYIWVDVSENPASVTQKIISQARKYTHQNETAPEQSAVQMTRSLLKAGPVVMLFDAVDTANTEQLDSIENFLKDLIDDEKLFVVLASKKALSFQQERSVARKLTTRSLQSLDRENCELYLDNLDQPPQPEIRDYIFQWTHGYPLAMNIMAQAVNRGVDPRTDQGREEILALFTDLIINKEVLENVPQEEKARYRSMLQLFAVPRRFNLVIMQDLIEEFLPELKRESSLAYFSLPKEISDATAVMNWGILRAGFSIDEPLRTILLLLLKNEQPQRYFTIHDFLAQTNLHLAKDFPGLDRARYVRESLYHIACNTHSPALQELLTQALHIVLQETPEVFQQFLEEFLQDDELKEALGAHLAFVQLTINAYRTKSNPSKLEE